MTDAKNIFLTPGGDKYWNQIEWPFRLLRPIEMCACFLVDEQFISIVTKRGLITLENVRPLLQHVKRIFGQHSKLDGVMKIEQLLTDSPFNEAAARRERENDFETVHRHSIIAMWSAIEFTIEDIVIDVICNDPTAISRLSSAGVDLPRKLSQPLTELDARRVFRNAESSLRRSLSSSATICKIICVLGIPFEVDPNELSFADEVNAVRNCLMHRGGLIDDQSIRAAPSLAPMKGRRFVVTEEYHQKVFKTLSAITNALGVGVVAYMKSISS